MDYIRQMRGFRERRKSHPISAVAIALYLAIFEYANDVRFPESFSVSTLFLRASASLSEGTFKRARAELVSQGYIQYQSGTGRQHGTYTLIDLSIQPGESGRFEGQCGLQNNLQNDPQSESDIFAVQIGPQNNLQNGPQTAERVGLPSTLRAKTGGNLAHYNNYNYKDKQEEKGFSKFIGHSSSSSRAMEFFGMEEDEGQTLQEKNVQEICSCWRRDIGEPSLSVQRTFRRYLQAGMETGLICRAVEQTAVSAKNPPVYLLAVLEDWKRQGHFTLAAYDAARSPRNLRTGICADDWNSSPPSYDLEEVNQLILESAIKGASRLQEAVV